MNIFAIQNKTTGDRFKTHRGKQVWSAPGHAKNAWNNAQPYRYGRKQDRFDDQEILEVVPCVIITKEEHDALLACQFRMEGLDK